jgi:hypothetical protein
MAERIISLFSFSKKITFFMAETSYHPYSPIHINNLASQPAAKVF